MFTLYFLSQQPSETHLSQAPEEVQTPLPVIEHPQQQDEEPWEEDQQPTFAIDAMMSPSAQSKIDEFIASLNEDEDEVSDRDLIPIKFKPTSRLSGMYTPSPSGSRANSRTGSRSNSRSGSRRASVSNSRRNSIIVINKTPPSLTQPQLQPSADNIIAAPTFTIFDENDTTAQQSQKLFAASSSMFSRKTPYTSAAVTPAIGLTPDEFGANGYFDDPEEEEGRDQQDFTFRPDFLNEAPYSLNESLMESATVEEWDPLNALNKLKEHSESMVLRQSLQEALVKTAKEQQEKEEEEALAAVTAATAEPVSTATNSTTEAPILSELFPMNKTSSKKKKYAFKSTWDDEEYDLPSALVSGESSPRTPIARNMSSSDLAKEIELEKERYKQQRASLMLAQPQAAVASMLEAELDLSRGTLFKRRYFDAPIDRANTIQSTERITQETSEALESESDDEEDAADFVAYYDDYVIQEAQKRLRALVTGEEVDTAAEMPKPIGGPKHNNIISKRPSHMYQYGEAKEPQPLSLLWNSQSYTSNFGFDAKHKLSIYQTDLIPTEDIAEEIKSLSTEIVVKEDPYTKKHRLAKEEEKRKLKEEQEKLEKERLLREKLEEEESAEASIRDAKLTLDNAKVKSVLSKYIDATKNETKDSESSSAITTSITAKPIEGLDKSVKSNATKWIPATNTSVTLDATANNDDIPAESTIPIQKATEKKPIIIHQASSSSSTSTISSSTTTSRHSFTSYASKSTKETTQTIKEKSNVSSLSNRTDKK